MLAMARWDMDERGVNLPTQATPALFATSDQPECAANFRTPKQPR